MDDQPHAYRMLLALTLGLWCAGCSDVECGTGTRLEGNRCVVSPEDAALAVTDGDVADAGIDARARTDAAVTADDAGEPIDAASLRCAARCECPANTTCAIEGVCEGSACTEPCGPTQPCPCGRACVDGYCDFLVGSLNACARDCDCPGREACVAGRCARVCGPGIACGGDVGCTLCGRVCDPFVSRCVEPGECNCHGSCSSQGLDGTLCDPATSRCQPPPGARLEPPGGPLDRPIGAYEYRLSTSATSAAGGAVTVVTLVADLAVDRDDFVTVSLRAPDGSVHMLELHWACAGGGGGFRWSGALDLSGEAVRRAGRWDLDIVVAPSPMPASRSADALWLYLDG